MSTGLMGQTVAGTFRNANEVPGGNLERVAAVLGDGRKACGGNVLDAGPKA